MAKQFENEASIVICYDYKGDWKLFCEAINNEIPAWLSVENIYRSIDQIVVQTFLLENRIKDHRALNDAKANRYAYMERWI